MKKYYVDGGSYPTHGDEFRLVKPSTGEGPYVWETKRQSALTKHHSHHYLLSEDRKTATLVSASFEASHPLDPDSGVGAPETGELSEQDYKGVVERITNNNICGRW